MPTTAPPTTPRRLFPPLWPAAWTTRNRAGTACG
ncbi:Uncharacterised protein [Bordetella pertussis]|nr:Uncharacterised protein [Bordetella pertussis]